MGTSLAIVIGLSVASAPAGKDTGCLVVRRLAREPVLDGIVKDDPAWVGDVAAGVIGRRLPAARQGRLWMGYGPKGLYVAVECAEPRTDRIRADGEDMDKLWEEDSVEVLVLPAGRKRPYRAVVNAIGARYNAPYGGRSGLGDWQARTFVGKGSWSAEIRIPFETLGELPAAEATWRGDVRRNLRTAGKPITASWAAGAGAGKDGLAPLRLAGALAAAERRAIQEKINRAARRSTFVFSRATTGQVFVRREGTASKVLDLGGPHVRPRLVPGGGGILFNSRKGGRVGVWAADGQGGTRRRVCDGDQVACSLDGQRIAFRRGGRIFAADPVSGAEQAVSPADWRPCGLPAFAPGGGITFVRHGRPDRLFLVPRGGGQPRLLVAGEIASPPRFSPDGRWIACPLGSHVWLIEAASGRRRLLTLAEGVQGWPAWSVDSAAVCYTQGHDGFDECLDVYCVRIDRPDRPRAVLQKVHPGFDWFGSSPRAGEPESLNAARIECLLPGRPLSPSAAERLGQTGQAKWQALPQVEAKAAGGAIARNGEAALMVFEGMDHALLLVGGPARPAGRMRIRPLDAAGKPLGPVRAVALRASPDGRAVLSAAFKADGGKTARVALALHGRKAAVEIAGGAGAGGAAVECDFDAAVVPDRLANDPVFDAAAAPPGEIALPYAPVTHLLAGGVLGVVITPSGRQTVRLIRPPGGERFSGLRVLAGGEAFHVGALTGGRSWQRVAFARSDKRGQPMAKWSAPARALWRLATRRGGALASTMIPADAPVRSLRWPGPADGPPVVEAAAYIYLYGRTRHTPLGLASPMDLLRDVLGLRAAGELLDVRGVRAARTAETWVPFQDYRNTLVVLGWIRGCDRKGVAETVGHLCGDVSAALAGLDQRVAEYEAFLERLASICRAGRGAGADAAALCAWIDEQVRQVRAAAAKAGRSGVDDLEAPAGQLRGVAIRRRQIGRSGEFVRFRRAADAAFARRRQILAGYRQLAQAVRDRAGLAVARRPALADLCRRLRAAAGATLRNRYYLEADWRGETPLDPPRVSYEQISKW